jgi:hypothetical protein
MSETFLPFILPPETVRNIFETLPPLHPPSPETAQNISETLLPSIIPPQKLPETFLKLVQKVYEAFLKLF